MQTSISFRDHLTQLESAGLLLRVKKEVDPAFEIPALVKKAAQIEKAILFEHVKEKNHAVAANVAVGRRMLSLALSLEEKKFLHDLSSRTIADIGVTALKNAPVQEIVEDERAIADLPLLTHFELDAGKYITAGIVIAKDPDSGFRNSSFNRLMLRTDSKLGIRMMPPQHLGIIQSKAEAKKKNLQVAVVIGNHPAEMIASASSLRFGKDHLDFASALRGSPLEVAKCKTLDLVVPANAEVVIEGEIEADVREEEGPFGEFMDYYVNRNKNHVLKINAITRRSDYIYQGLLCGSKEDLGILALNRELLLYNSLTNADYDVQDVSLMPFLFNGLISLKKRFDGEPKNAMMAAFGAYSWLKYCVVVDEDVNVHSLDDVWWALATRSQPEKGLVLVGDSLGFPRKDKSAIHRGKLGMDATKPLEMKKEFERKKIQGEDSINLSSYL